jgi:1,4-alpha-glucan branching enzyme
MHNRANRFVKDLVRVYNHYSCFYELDHNPDGFRWIDQRNYDQSIYSFIRFGKDKLNFCVVILNLTPVAYTDFQIGVPEPGVYQEVLNSDKDIYGGSNIYNGTELHTIDTFNHGYQQSISVNISPLSISIIKYDNRCF